MFLGLLFGCTGFVIMGAANFAWVFMAGIPFVALWGLAGPSMQSLMSRRVAPTEQGQLQGALGSIRGITGMIGPVIVTGTFAQTAGPRALIEAPGTVYYLAAALVIATMFVAWRATQPRAALATE
jgi:MFS transporter, DHA1 family, tetracycline resistance protein